MDFFVCFLMWGWGGLILKTAGSERPLSGRRGYRNGYTERGWHFTASLISLEIEEYTQTEMTQCRQQPLERKQHSPWHGEVIVLAVIILAAPCLCQTIVTPLACWDCQGLDEQEAVNRRTGASVQLANSLPGSPASRVPYCLPVQQLVLFASAAIPVAM